MYIKLYRLSFANGRLLHFIIIKDGGLLWFYIIHYTVMSFLAFFYATAGLRYHGPFDDILEEEERCNSTQNAISLHNFLKQESIEKLKILTKHSACQEKPAHAWKSFPITLHHLSTASLTWCLNVPLHYVNDSCFILLIEGFTLGTWKSFFLVQLGT